MKLTFTHKIIFYMAAIVVALAFILSGESYTEFWVGAQYGLLLNGCIGLVIQAFYYYRNRTT
ncbi:hypothetical protein [Pontibacter sp. H249]|uniref:hypothetical protein n=1 Tax=Pontibacter sp. H249 TaxID=3133420 RepID=UPI0030BADEEC